MASLNNPTNSLLGPAPRNQSSPRKPLTARMTF